MRMEDGQELDLMLTMVHLNSVHLETHILLYFGQLLSATLAFYWETPSDCFAQHKSGSMKTLLGNFVPTCVQTVANFQC